MAEEIDTEPRSDEIIPQTDFLRLTVDLVTAYVSNSANQISPERLPDVIREVRSTLQEVNTPEAAPAQKLTPAVPIRNSIKGDYLICLEDGKKLRMLRRHLATKYNMTPEQYRAKWGLPPTYPMTAPAYAEKRSEIAKKIGLGQNRHR